MDSASSPVSITETSGMIRFYWAQLRAAVKCEKLGMRHSSGRSAKAAAARELGLKRNTTYDEVIAVINKKLGES